MGVQVKADAFLELVDESAEVEQLGTGFTFTEGPIWNPEGFLLFSDMPGDVRRRWDPDSGVSEVANPSNKGNGMTIDNDGRLVVCEHVTSSVVRMDPDGTGGGREVLATHYEGQASSTAPTTSWSRATAPSTSPIPTYGRMPGFGIEREQDLDFQGVYRIAPGRRRPAAAGRRLRPAQRAVLLDRRVAALHQRHHARAHPRLRRRRPTARIANSRVLADGIGSGSLEIGDLVDGMKLDERGNVWVTGPGRRVRLRPRRQPHRHRRGPRERRQHQLGRRPDWNELFIPATTSMYRIQCKVSGNRLPYMR